ncbi:MAG: M28 family peptidase [Spirulina sp. SIO3F2]|nr:M28 family peptidase [Spirulina sp. SIO3F2]
MSTAHFKPKLERDLQQIARPRDPYFAQAGHFFVREYIRAQLGQLGIVQVHSFDVRGMTHENLILDLCPQSNNLKQRSPILIGAHYDAVPGTPGADDNATGVAVLLALARYFSDTPPRSPLRFVAFDMEEYGLLGSHAYAQWLKAQHQQLRLMLSLEMLGYTAQTQTYPAFLKHFYPAKGNFIALVGNVWTMPDLWRLSRQIRKAGTPCEWLPAGFRGHLVPDTRRSDHAPFWDAGYRAMMVTDTANLRNPYYHLEGDRLETLNLDFLAGVCQSLAIALREL